MQALEMGHKLAVLQERYRREEKQELWRSYMAMTVRQLGAEFTYEEAVERYEWVRKPESEKKQEVEAAKEKAFGILASLERSRGGVEQ